MKKALKVIGRILLCLLGVEYQNNLFALGLQWHPERDALSDTRFTNVSQDLSNLPLRALVEHASIYAAQ